MARADVIKALDELRGGYPSYKPPNLDALVALWVRKFEHIDGDILLRAADLHMDENKYFPSISNIREQLDKAEYQINNERVVSLHDLRGEVIALENKLWRQDRYDSDEWESLADKYEQHGYQTNADWLRQRIGQT